MSDSEFETNEWKFRVVIDERNLENVEEPILKHLSHSLAHCAQKIVNEIAEEMKKSSQD